MSDTYMLTVAEIQIPKIIKGTMGRIHLTIHDLSGKDVNLNEYDEIVLTLKNYPEKDEIITKSCLVSTDDDTICYFDFTIADSTSWTSAPYIGEVEFKRYVRDDLIVTTTTGYVPEKSYMSFSGCTTDFKVGDVITGAVSGSTAVVWAFEDYGGIGELELIKVSGAFLDEERITSPGGGLAYVVVGVSLTEYLADRYADDSSDFVALGVIAGDEIVIGSGIYIVDSFDSVAADWLVVKKDNESPGNGITYTINTFNSGTSAMDDLLKSLPFTLYIAGDL